MGEEIKKLIKNLSKYTLSLSIVISLIIFFIWGINYSFTLLLGSIISLVGFILSSWSLNNALNHNKGKFSPILINIIKAFVIAIIAAYFFINDVKLGVSFIVGFILLFPGLIIHSVNS